MERVWVGEMYVFSAWRRRIILSIWNQSYDWDYSLYPNPVVPINWSIDFSRFWIGPVVHPVFCVGLLQNNRGSTE